MYLRLRNIFLDILIFFCKEFINILNEELVKKFVIRVFQRGVGSIEYIDMLLIIEDLENEDIIVLILVLQKILIEVFEVDSGIRILVYFLFLVLLERFSGFVSDWCKCGQCRIVLQEIENKCCNMRICVFLSRRFQKFCLDFVVKYKEYL